MNERDQHKPFELSRATPHDMKQYRHTLVFVVAMAARRLFPERVMSVQHGFGWEQSQLSDCYFCVFRGMDSTLEKDLEKLEQSVKDLIAEDLRILSTYLDYDDALTYFEKVNIMPYTKKLLASRSTPWVRINKCEEFQALWHRRLLPSTGLLSLFALEKCETGFLIRFPSPASPNTLAHTKTENMIIDHMYRDHHEWGKIAGIKCAGNLNNIISDDKSQELVFLCEALSDLKIVEIAKTIHARRDSIKLVLIAGPSCSGETTMACKLQIYLRTLGLKPCTISTEDYLFDAHDGRHPKTASGEPDVESIDAIDIAKLDSHLSQLVAGNEVETAVFDGAKHKSKSVGRTMQLEPGGVIVVLGNHGLNPRLTSSITEECKFRVYVAPLSQLNVDELHYTSNQVTRLLRRMARDHASQGRSARDTLNDWGSVLAQEEKNIFPFVSNADVVFNSALEYEIPVLRVRVQPLLETIKPGHAQHAVARELLMFLECFHQMSESVVPSTSLLKEFSGRSSFSPSTSTWRPPRPTKFKSPAFAGTLVHATGSESPACAASPLESRETPDETQARVGCRVMDVLPGITEDTVAARCNNLVVGLNSRLNLKHSYMEPIQLNSADGMKVLHRSLVFLLGMACKEVFPDRRVQVEHGFGVEHSQMSTSYFCVFAGISSVPAQDVKKIQDHMKQIVAEDRVITEHLVPYGLAVEFFLEQGLNYSAQLFRSRNDPWVRVNCCHHFKAPFHHPLVPSTRYLSLFELEHHADGFALRMPTLKSPTQLLPFVANAVVSSVYEYYNTWGNVLQVACAGQLNEVVLQGAAPQLVNLCEAQMDLRIVEIAKQVYGRRDTVKCVLIAGPSTSGKTTFASKLCIFLRTLGLKPVTLSTDDYYRANTDPDHPRDSNGSLDYECVEALRLDVFNQHLAQLFRGETVETALFDFMTHCPRPYGRPLTVPPGGIVIMEGIFCLNPALTSSIPDDCKFKIYIAPLSQLNTDEFHFISNQITRLIRRISRDHLHRDRTATFTIGKWPGIIRGEERNIFPYVDTADAIYNSSVDYEPSVLRSIVQPLLETVKPVEPEYQLARELLEFLGLFHCVPASLVPSTSLLQEFIGVSPFEQS